MNREVRKWIEQSIQTSLSNVRQFGFPPPASQAIQTGLGGNAYFDTICNGVFILEPDSVSQGQVCATVLSTSNEWVLLPKGGWHQRPRFLG
jgi:hypothetical protein